MQFLAIMRRRVEAFSEAEFTARLDAELERVRQLYAAGTIRSIYSRGDVPGAVIVLETSDEAAARAALDSLPLALLGMLDAQLIALRPYRGFADPPALS